LLTEADGIREPQSESFMLTPFPLSGADDNGRPPLWRRPKFFVFMGVDADRDGREIDAAF
jgi:hypothetical protein